MEADAEATMDAGAPSLTHHPNSKNTILLSTLHTPHLLHATPLQAGMYHRGYVGEDGKRVKGFGLTPHSIRRSACQWAGRCNAGLVDLANNGRWQTVVMILQYHSLGAKKRQECISLYGKDRIFSTWVWKPVTQGGVSAVGQIAGL